MYQIKNKKEKEKMPQLAMHSSENNSQNTILKKKLEIEPYKHYPELTAYLNKCIDTLSVSSRQRKK